MNLIILASASVRSWTCTGSWEGCFHDGAPAVGVPVVRVVDHLLKGPIATLTVDECASTCTEHGYAYAGLTGGVQPGSGKVAYYCYCGCTLNTAAPREPGTTCNTACTNQTASSSNQTCGGNGVMSAYAAQCVPKPPPSSICGNGTALPSGPACSQKAAIAAFAFCDVSLSLEARVKDLVDRITMIEAGPLLTARQSPAIPRLGIPPFYWGTNAIHGLTGACDRADPHRPLSGCATTFPQALNIATTWNRTLMRGVGRTVGREMRAFANLNLSANGLTSWAPTINIIRDPRWGRNQETASEDPLLAGTYGAEWSLGMQFDLSGTERGTARPTGPAKAGELMAVASLKHFTGYSLEQWSPDGNWSRDVYDRINFNSVLSPLDLESTYSQPFKRAIMRGGAAGVMYACNEVNGKPSVANPALRDMLDSWGYDGYRTTDGDGINAMNTPSRQNYTTSQVESIAKALIDGHTDIDDGGTFANHLVDALAAGLINMTDVRRALTSTFRIRFRLGLFDPLTGPHASPYLKYGAKDVNDAAAQALNVNAARQSLVLLQKGVGSTSDHPYVLPFSVKDALAGDVVVIGGSANSTKLLSGSYARSLAHVDGLETGGYPGIPEALRSFLGKNATHGVKWYPGIECIDSHPGTPSASQICDRPRASATLLAEAVNAAQNAAQVILVLNLQAQTPCDKEGAVDGEFNPCGYEAEQHDRYSIELPRVQQALADAVIKVTKTRAVPTAVVLIHGGALAIDTIKASGVAILDAHYPGSATGARAVVEALYGVRSPGGKLTYTVMPSAFTNLSNFASMDMTVAPGRTYKYYHGETPALWPFGYGLSFAEFTLSKCASSALNGTTAATVSCELSNVGTFDGKAEEVVQLYHVPDAGAEKITGAPVPKRVLIDFERVAVPRGGSTAVRFTVDRTQLLLATKTGDRVLFGTSHDLVVSRGDVGEEVKLVVKVQGELQRLNE